MDDALTDTYRARTPASRDLYLRAREIMPGGIARNTGKHDPYPLAIVRGSGTRAWDADDNEYIDLLNNYGSLIHGYQHAPTMSAIHDALAMGAGSAAPTPAQIQLAEELVSRVPSADLIRFCNSGTEAGMLAIRIARAVSGRALVLKATRGYHGGYDQLIDETRQPLQQFVLRGDFGNLPQFRGLVEQRRDDLAAIIIEPILGSIVQPPAGFLLGLQELARWSGAAFILDEVMMFRLAYEGAQSVFGLDPDLTMLGKFIGGGIPVGALTGKSRWLRAVDPTHESGLWHSGTFSGNVLAASAGLATLRAFDRSTIDTLNDLSRSVQRLLQDALDEVRLPVRVNLAGSLIGLSDEDASNHADDARVDSRVASPLIRSIHLALLNEGVIMAPRGFAAISTALTSEDLKTLESAFGDAARGAASAWAHAGSDVEPTGARRDGC